MVAIHDEGVDDEQRGARLDLGVVHEVEVDQLLQLHVLRREGFSDFGVCMHEDEIGGRTVLHDHGHGPWSKVESWIYRTESRCFKGYTASLNPRKSGLM